MEELGPANAKVWFSDTHGKKVLGCLVVSSAWPIVLVSSLSGDGLLVNFNLHLKV